jgi:integrase
MQGCVAVIEHEVVIYKRSRSSLWQCRYKLKDKKWRRTSTGERAENEAKKAALRIFYEGEYKRANKLPIDSKRFAGVADSVAQQLQSELDEGRGKSVYRSYIFAINGYLKPFFGKHGIDSITPALLKEFEVWRANEMGRAPKASTISTHNSALNKIFDLAELHGWITPAVRPSLVNKGKKSEARPSFTLEEYNKLTRSLLPKWAAEGRTEKSRMMRELLRDYVLVLANTGIRHGTEAYNLKWRHIDWHKVGGEQYLRLTVSGKTGPRSVIARHNTVNYLRRIQQRFAALNGMTFDELLKSKVDEYVFRLADGSRTTNLHQTFEALMKETELAIGATSEKPRTLYSFRHMYATFQLQNKVGIHELARQMGTSVKMLEDHYSKITPELMASVFAGPKMGKQEEPEIDSIAKVVGAERC